MNGLHLSNGSKGLVIINSIFLFVALSDEAGLVAVKLAINLEFDRVHAFNLNGMMTRGKRDQVPSVIFSKHG